VPAQGRASPRLHSPAVLAKVAPRFLKRGPWLANATFLINRTLVVAGTSWTVSVGLHIHSNTKALRQESVRLDATITFMPPPGLPDTVQRRLARVGFYRLITKTVKGWGYSGKWIWQKELGRYACFEKNLDSTRAVLVEADRLEGEDFGALVSAFATL